ncbi:MAG: stage IV sporulation protein A [Clostridia bacterium]
MENFDVYTDITNRTNGDIYIGVVGPVRTGKSTFITKFMEKMVLPEIASSHAKSRMIDELPQAGSGKTIMTMQPKFVPSEAVLVALAENANARVRLVDCVGYLIDGAEGHSENNEPRLVTTPWSTEKMTMKDASEFGTSKVIREHSTIAVVVTTDGSITGIDRLSYTRAEERVIAELKEINKPFVIVLNSTKPDAEATLNLATTLEEKYSAPVVALSVNSMEKEDIKNILEKVLFEFPARRIEFTLPAWVQALPADNEVIYEIISNIKKDVNKSLKMKEINSLTSMFKGNENIGSPTVSSFILGEGRAVLDIPVSKDLFYKMISNICAVDIKDDFYLMSFMKYLTHAKTEYDKLKDALESVNETGYGIVMPTMEEMKLEAPQILNRGTNSGVRLKASAPSLHIMRVDVETEVCPAVGGMSQSEDFSKYMLAEFENSPEKIWDTNMFGKPLSALVREGIHGKLQSMPEEAHVKIRKTLTKIVNEGKGGMICILL